MALVEQFRAGELHDAFVRIAGVLDEHAQALDLLEGELDGGAGTDLAASLRAALENVTTGAGLVALTSKMASVAKNYNDSVAGVVLGEWLGALAEVSSNADSVDGARFAMALELCSEGLAEVAEGPDAGGVTAVVAAASVGALRAADQRLGLADVIIAAANEGLDELESGVSSNPRLAEHGVVDASAAGFLLILDSFAALVTGDQLPTAPTTAGVGDVGDLEPMLITCSIVPLETGHVGAEVWIESCAWIESVWHELGTLRRFEILSGHCRAELETSDAGRAIEALCTVARPRELRIAALSGASNIRAVADTDSTVTE